MNRKFALVGTALLLLVALTGWLRSLVEPQRSALPVVERRHAPDYFLEKSIVVTMDSNGNPRHELRSDRLIHYADDDSTELTNPYLTLHTDTAPPWTVEADKGWVGADGHSVLLRGGVVVERAASPVHDGTRLRTTELNIRPYEKYAETDKPVVMTSGASLVEAVGMRAYVGEGKLQLLNSVRGKYE